jgi:uncharacterized protein (DUF1330 family)
MAKQDFTKEITDAINKATGARNEEQKAANKQNQTNKKLNKTRKTERELLEALVKSQTAMVQTLRSLNSATKSNTRSTRNLNKQNLLWVKNTRILGGSLAVLRSKLLVFTFGIGLLQRSIGRLLGEYGEFEESQRRISKVIESTGGAAGITAEEVFAMNAEFEKATGIAETYINQVSGLLLTFTNISQDAIPSVTKSVLDMTAIMNNGSVTFETLKTTAIQVGKALNNPIKGITALRRVGVAFTRGQKAFIASLQNQGKLLEAQEIILKELNKEFGDQSNLNTYNQSVLRLNTAFGNLAKEIGGKLRPQVEELVKSLTKLIESLDVNKLGNFAKQIAVTTIAFAALKKTMQLVLIGMLSKVNTIKRLTVVLKSGALAMFGLNSATRKAAIGVRIFTVGIKALTGPAGLILLATSLLPSFINLFSKSEEAAESAGAEFLKTSGELETLEKSTKSTRKEWLELKKAMNIGGDDNFSQLIPEASPELINKIRQAGEVSKETGENIEKHISDPVGDATEKFRQMRWVLNASSNEFGIADKNMKRIADTLASVGANIIDEEGNLTNFQEAWENLDSTLQNVILEYNNLSLAMDLNKQRRIADIAITKAQGEAYVQFFGQLSSGITNYLDHDLNRWKEGELSRLEVQKDVIKESRMSDKAKTVELEKVNKKIEEINKKAHNKELSIKAITLSANLASSIANIKIATAAAIAMASMNPATALVTTSLLKTMEGIQIASAVAGYGVGIAGLAAQRAAQGADFVTNKPQLLLVGDNPGAREHVQVTPLSSPNIKGPQGSGGALNIYITGNVLSQDFIEGDLADNIRDAVARGVDYGLTPMEITKALSRGRFH